MGLIGLMSLISHIHDGFSTGGPVFNLAALDKLIAVVVVLLVLSLIVQSVQAAIKKFLGIKSLQLEQSLVHLFYYALDKDPSQFMNSRLNRLPVLRAFVS